MDWVIWILLLKIFIALLSSSLSSFLPSSLPLFLLLFLPSFQSPPVAFFFCWLASTEFKEPLMNYGL